MVRRSCATAAHPEGAVRAGRSRQSDCFYVVRVLCSNMFDHHKSCIVTQCARARQTALSQWPPPFGDGAHSQMASLVPPQLAGSLSHASSRWTSHVSPTSVRRPEASIT